jgi:type I restriction enzyme R subunit
VGVCEQDKTDSHTLNRKPSATLEEVLNYVAQGGTDPEALVTLAGRLARLQRDFSADQLAELKDLAGGKSFPDLAHDLLNACDPGVQRGAARDQLGVSGEPAEEQLHAAAQRLAQDAVTPFLKAVFRRRILEIRQQNEQTIDRHTIDDVLYSGFDAAAVDKAQTKVRDFRLWIEDRKDELTALQVLYAGTRPLKLSLKDLRQLRDALARPPLVTTPEQLWRAYQAVEAEKVKRSGGQVLTDLVSLVRHALIPSFSLVPYAEELLERYNAWRLERTVDKNFTLEQRAWLDRMAAHIATSLAIKPEDFEDGWFGQHGSLSHAHTLFGDKLLSLMAELNDRLAA